MAIKNLKYDPLECVSELLVNYNVLAAEDSISNFDYIGGSIQNSEP